MNKLAMTTPPKLLLQICIELLHILTKGIVNSLPSLASLHKLGDR